MAPRKDWEKVEDIMKNIKNKTTREQVVKVIEINGVFYAKTKSRHFYLGSVTYNDVLVYRGRSDNILKIVLQCRRCEDDSVIDEQEFHLLADGWHQVSALDGEYLRAITEKDLNEIPRYWVFIVGNDEDFTEYVNNLFRILR